MTRGLQPLAMRRVELQRRAAMQRDDIRVAWEDVEVAGLQTTAKAKHVAGWMCAWSRLAMVVVSGLALRRLRRGAVLRRVTAMVVLIRALRRLGRGLDALRVAKGRATVSSPAWR
jgi:hypothetical protein